MARDREREAWDKIERVGTQGDSTNYRLKGGRAVVNIFDKASVKGTELLKQLRRAEREMESAPAATVAVPAFAIGHAWLFEPDPDARSCGTFTEDTNGIRVADVSGRSTLIPDADLRELVRLCARRMTAAREAERKAAEKRVADLEAQLGAARERAGRLK